MQPTKANDITRLVAILIATEDLPISLVESEGFRNLLSFLEPGFEPPCRKTMTSNIKALYNEEKAALKTRLEEVEGLSLTTDCWTSLTQEGYMTITAHYIDEIWENKAAVLDTSPVGHLPSEEEELEDGGEATGVTGPQRHTVQRLHWPTS